MSSPDKWKVRYKKLQGKVQLVAIDKRGVVILESIVSFQNYYDDSNELIDSGDFRKRNEIVKIVGRIYNPSGKLSQEFVNEYDFDGEYVKGRAEFDDGTVQED